MTGDLIIDGVDIYSTFGGYTLEGGLNDIMAWPAAKEVHVESWQERDFVDADLEEIRYAAKEATINFAFRGDIRNIIDFYNWFKVKDIRAFNFASVGRQFNLRFIGYESLSYDVSGRQLLSIKVSEDIPYAGYDYVAPSASCPDTGYLLNGTDLATYGIAILQGTTDTAAKQGNLKQRLSRNISIRNGLIYDNGSGIPNKSESHEIVLRCALIDTTYPALWRNYDALFHDLIRPDMTVNDATKRCRRILYCPTIDKTYACYYMSQQIVDFSPGGGKIWLVFDLSLKVIGEAIGG